MAEKKRLKLQPSIPKFRKKKHPEQEKEAEVRKEIQKKERNWRVIYGIAAVLVVVLILVVIVFVYSAPSPRMGNAVSDSQVREELARLREISAYTENMNINPKGYPETFGVWRNQTLVEQYFCSDVCPDYGRVDLVFQGVGPEDCASAGGRELRDLAWGEYIGCGPEVD